MNILNSDISVLILFETKLYVAVHAYTVFNFLYSVEVVWKLKHL